MIQDEMYILLNEDDSFDVVVNKHLEVHIKRNDIGYSVDLYKYASPEKMNDDYDFDSDFISGCIALDDDLEN